MRNPIFAAATGLAAVASASAHPALPQDAEAVVLQPASTWQLDMAENKCRVARLFGEGEEKTVFYLEQWDPSRAAAWSVAGPSVEKFRAERDTSFAFGPGGDEAEFKFMDSNLGDYGNAVTHTTTIVANENPEEEEEGYERDYMADPRGVPALDGEGAALITTLTLSQKGRDDVVLELGSMKAPLNAMNVCMADLVQHWGFDVEQQKTVQSPPVVKNLERVARRIMQDYPSEALRRGGQADFHMRLTVDAAGSVEHCVLINQTLAEGFDMRRHPCTAFEKLAEFEPARTAAGDPVSSFYVGRIIYRLP